MAKKNNFLILVCLFFSPIFARVKIYDHDFRHLISKKDANFKTAVFCTYRCCTVGERQVSEKDYMQNLSRSRNDLFRRLSLTQAPYLLTTRSFSVTAVGPLRIGHSFIWTEKSGPLKRGLNKSQCMDRPPKQIDVVERWPFGRDGCNGRLWRFVCI